MDVEADFVDDAGGEERLRELAALRLSTHQHRVDRCPVGLHELLDVAAEVEPIHAAIGGRDEPIQTASGAVGDGSHSRILGRGLWRSSG